jgi:hypothetical protein
MATISIISNEGVLDSASAVLEVTATNPEYNQPTLHIKQAGTRGGAASIRIDDPNPDIELIETDQVAPAGKYEIAVQSDKLQINGRNTSDTSFETMFVFQRLGAGGNIGFRTTSQFGGGQGVIAIANASVESFRWWDFVCRGWGTQVSRLEWNGYYYRTSLGAVYHR